MDKAVDTHVACPVSAGDARATRLNGWLLTEGRSCAQATTLLSQLAGQLRAAGLPVDRATVHLPQNHPQFAGYTAAWTADGGIVIDRTVTRRDLFSIMYFNSPVALMHRTGLPVRRRLEGVDADIDFRLFDDLIADGITDYLLMPLAAGLQARPPGFSIATRRPGGFCDADIALAEAILPALGAVVDIMQQRFMMRGLLDAYVGREAARHILNGEVVAGGGRTIEAVILFADLRGFTRLSEGLPRDRVLALLNDFFARVVTPVLAHGGEVLKFLGDGLLAVFPLDPQASPDRRAGLAADAAIGDDEQETVARSMMATLEAHRGIEEANAARRATGDPEIQAGLALHVGSVLFGNIGTDERLDFTVIGPAVNLAARLQQLCGELGRPILLSERFAARCPVQLRPEGRYRLRGVAEEQDVFSPVVLPLTTP